MISFDRTDTSVVARWWWTIDRWTVAAIALLIVFGAMLSLAASPPVADRLGYDSYHFVRRQLFFLPFAIALLIGVSLLSPRGVRRLAAVVLCVGIVAIIATLAFGSEIKGARRWISLTGLTVQPSEFVKPCFAVIAAWLFAMRSENGRHSGRSASVLLYGLLTALLLMQPDVGMTVVVSAAWFTQFFLAGLPLFGVGVFVVTGAGAAVAAYFLFPHVARRIDQFIDPASGDNFQIARSMEAFTKGGAFGRGPGEGSVKSVLPDAHTDFVFAVAGEEFGLVACLILVGLFAFVVLRGFGQVIKESNLFVLLAATGLLVQFGLQALVNMGSTLRLMPTKGMTLPFISYGGSSLAAVALCIGMLLALTRRRVGQEPVQ
ncbi:MAG: putative peptidoglycan glycosyltransferase FtsW [Proteobacteria bacterium]|nr:putative peptidoglycan glycosyltransferase FtsW [Pseudomonadota bacterium]MDA1323368.1 putative peptidoglycan glycosyltransferase FtsW [Pseudomonadota bacterium]